MWFIIVLEHIKFSRRLWCNKKTYEFYRRSHNSFMRTHIKFFKENLIWYTNTFKFSWRDKASRTNQNFQENLLKILQEHIWFSEEKIPIRTDQIFQKRFLKMVQKTDHVPEEKYTIRTDKISQESFL